MLDENIDRFLIAKFVFEQTHASTVLHLFSCNVLKFLNRGQFLLTALNIKCWRKESHAVLLNTSIKRNNNRGALLLGLAKSVYYE